MSAVLVTDIEPVSHMFLPLSVVATEQEYNWPVAECAVWSGIGTDLAGQCTVFGIRNRSG